MGRPRLPVGQLAKVRYHRHRKGVTGDTYVWDCTGRQRRLRLTGSSEADALKFLKRKAAVLGALHAEASEHSTLAHLLNDWFTEVVERRGLRPQTERTYCRRIERLKKVFGAILVEQLTPAWVQGIAFEISQLRESFIERRLLRNVLKQALRYATMLAIFPSNPYNSVEPMPKRNETPNPTALNPAQVKVFRDAFADYASGVSIYSSRRKAQVVVDIALGVRGLRINEVLGLRNRDVDFDAGVVHVNGTLTHQSGLGVLRQDELKARRQEREITITRGHVGYQALKTAWNESVDHSPRRAAYRERRAGLESLDRCATHSAPDSSSSTDTESHRFARRDGIAAERPHAAHPSAHCRDDCSECHRQRPGRRVARSRRPANARDVLPTP